MTAVKVNGAFQRRHGVILMDFVAEAVLVQCDTLARFDALCIDYLIQKPEWVRDRVAQLVAAMKAQNG